MVSPGERPGTLGPLLVRVAAICPALADPFEATAIVESLGYTDRIIREEFGVPDSRALGGIVYEQLRREPVQSPARDDAGELRRHRLREDLRVLAQTCSLSLIYSMPWIGAFVFQRVYPSLMQIPSDAAAPLSVALIASLILSGGFVQCIARKGQFYMGLSQPRMVAAVCGRIWEAGVATSTVVATIAVTLGLYFEVFQPKYLVLAAGHFITLTLLWMSCAVLWLSRTYWEVPAVFVSGAGAFWLAHQAGYGALASTMVSTMAAVNTALLLLAYRSPLRRSNRGGGPVRTPRYGVIMRSLAPYFCYGVGYFSFVFADRVAAGTAVSTSAGVQFAIDAGYKLGMDISLLLFLMSMTAVEYINYDFMRFWQDEARRWTPSEGERFRARLRRRYACSRLSVVGVYAALAAVVWMLVGLPDVAAGPLPRRVLIFGATGYLLLELALFNVLVLFSVNATVGVLQSLVPALIINACAGYLLGNTLGPLWAAVAMATGAAVFLWQSQFRVRDALARPGYCYYMS